MVIISDILLLVGFILTSVSLYDVISAGTNIGEISLWEVSAREKLVSRNFQVWDIGASSMTLKVCCL